MDQLPTKFDIIIVGTGLVESVISAAASRIGKNVLHIDNNNYYGGLWASFNLEAFQKLGDSNHSEVKDNDLQLNSGEKLHKIGNSLYNLQNFTHKWNIPLKAQPEIVASEEKPEFIKLENDVSETLSEPEPNIKVYKNNKRVWTQETVLKDFRKFNIDLTPKLQFSRGDLVELLISSNIARYSEYRSVTRVITWLNGQLEVVPCSRSDVFANSKVSVVEKRMLMKLLTSVDDNSAELNAYENKSFRNYLKDKKLTANLIHYVLYAISMSTDETPCLQGTESTKRFLHSLGRFGKTPFLFSMYGCGEIAQAFCRLSAVFRGIYALGQPLHGFIVDENDKFKELICDKLRISADYLVMGVEKSPEKFVKTDNIKYISRAVFMTDRSIMSSEKEPLTLLIYPPENGKEPCTIIEIGTSTGTCPENIFLVHMVTKQTVNPEEDFKHIVYNLFDFNSANKEFDPEKKPQVLWSSYFSIPDSNELDLRSGVPKNVFLCPGPDIDLDYDLSIKKAKEIFNEIYPGEEFLPRAPDPEEIVIDGEDAASDEKENNVSSNELKESGQVTTKKSDSDDIKLETETKEIDLETVLTDSLAEVALDK